MLNTIRARYPGFVVLRAVDDFDRYDAALNTFAKGGSRTDLMTTLFGLGIPATQIGILASYPGRTLPAMWGE